MPCLISSIYEEIDRKKDEFEELFKEVRSIKKAVERELSQGPGDEDILLEEYFSDEDEAGDAVEEGEEAALALDAQPTEADMVWLSAVQAAVCHSQESGPLSCRSQEDETGPLSCHAHEEGPNAGPKGNTVSDSIPVRQSPDFKSTEGWDIHCQSRQSDSCHGENLA